ncbi:MAG: hypothetical protein CM15mP83_6530 [Flavobacteriaceae bacterium]|nr:MAG: hypothetical protein CM15mP83_6530 [Flavobacteriaceae bacterium]
MKEILEKRIRNKSLSKDEAKPHSLRLDKANVIRIKLLRF